MIRVFSPNDSFPELLNPNGDLKTNCHCSGSTFHRAAETAVCSIFQKVKRISHCIFKFCAKGFRVFFQSRKLFFLPNSMYLPRGHQCFYFDITYFISNYSYPLPLIIIICISFYLLTSEKSYDRNNFNTL